MTSLPFLMFLGVLAVMTSLVILILLGLDRMQVHPEEKLMILKLGFILTVVAPILFTTFHFVGFRTIELHVPSQISTRSIPLSTNPVVTAHEEAKWPAVLTWVYLGIVGVSAIRLMIQYFRMSQALGNSKLVVFNETRVHVHPTIAGPMTFGVWPKVYFPEAALALLGPREFQIALEHERNHARGNDPLWKIVALMARTMLFFNPISYVLFRRFEIETEVVCDLKTCVSAKTDVLEYGRLLIEMASSKAHKEMFTAPMTNSNLHRRIVAMKSRTIQRPLATVVISIVLVMTGTIATAAMSGLGFSKSSYRITTQIFIGGKLVSSPRISTISGEPAVISHMSVDDSAPNLRFQVIARDVSMPSAQEAILIETDLTYNQNGQKFRATPQMVVKPGEQGSITMNEGSSDSVELRILAERE